MVYAAIILPFRINLLKLEEFNIVKILDIMIVEILESSQSLGYKQIEYKINLRCEGLGLKKPSTKTFWLHMGYLRNIDVLYREEDRYGGTHYSLKKEFKEKLDEIKIDNPTTYVEKTLQDFSRYRDSFDPAADYGKAIEIIKKSSGR
jgi:hypothetical protein